MSAREVPAEVRLRDLTRRLGFGDNITEPQADNDTIVHWFEELERDASEWRESQRWRDECHLAGHSDLEDCFECDPTLRLEAAEERVRRVEDLAEWHETKAEKARRFRPDEQIVVMDKAAEVHADAARRIRAALAEEDAR